MTFSTRNFDSALIAPKSPKFFVYIYIFFFSNTYLYFVSAMLWCIKLCVCALEILVFFCLKHTVPVITDAQALQTYFLPFGTGSCLPKTTLVPKLARGWAKGASQKLWDPLLISATIEASNFKFGTQRGFGECATITALVLNVV